MTTTLNPKTATLSDIIAALSETNLSDTAKVRIITLAADPANITKTCVFLNHYFEDSRDAYVDDADAAIKAAEEAERRAEDKAKAEAQELARKTNAYNAALGNLMLRGMKMFLEPGKIDPKFQEALNAEIGKLLKGDRLYMTEAGEYFVPDSSRSNLSPEQLAALDKAEIEERQSNRKISNERKRHMSDGQHEVVICHYKEHKGYNGKPDYANVAVQEISTGKQEWLLRWSLADLDDRDPDFYRTRRAALESISDNNHDLLEGIEEKPAVKLLCEKQLPFSVWTYKRGEDDVLVYLDKKSYLKFLKRQRIKEELAEEREYRERELNAIGADPEAQDESYDKVAYKVGGSEELPF